MSGNLNEIGAAFVAALVVGLLLVHLILGLYMGKRQHRGQAKQRPISFLDEVNAISLQRSRKRQVVKQLRATARQARRDQGRRS